MRVNTRKTLNAFLAKKPLKPARSIWTDGNNIYSYSTILASRQNDDILFNNTKYSVTTTIHQHALVSALNVTKVFDGIPIGTQSF